MTHYYQNVYTALRSAMVDRDMGDSIEDAILIDFKSAHVALKKEIPSAALLISYSMLYYPSWLSNARPEVKKPPLGLQIEHFIGGVDNPKYPLLFNIHMGMIALAVGCYANLWTIKYSDIIGTVLVSPNMNNPLVTKTRELIMENKLTYSDARNVFIELMQQEEYQQGVLLADDFIANATFIEQDIVTADSTDPNERIQNAFQVDLSKDFGGISEGKDQ